MAKIIGDYRGTTWGDFLAVPGKAYRDKEFTPDDVDLSTEIAGINLKMPFMSAAMRSVTGKDLALAAGKLGMMAVAPRGLSIEEEADIVRYVKENAVEKWDIESELEPTTVRDTDTLAVAIAKSRKTGHSNIPVLARKHVFAGMFRYNPPEHDNMNPRTPMTEVMYPYKTRGRKRPIEVCKDEMSDGDIRKYLRKRYKEDESTRSVPVIDKEGRLEKLVFLQTFDAYNIGASIDTHPGWEERAEALADAGVDIIFIDTSDAHKPFSSKVIERHAEVIRKCKEMDKYYPPICGGNVVTGDAFDYLVKAGADAIKEGMGPGSICTTNQVLGVGAPPFWAMVEMDKARFRHFKKTGRYIALIADGGIENTHHMTVALPYADAIMGGKVFGCFFESEGERYDGNGILLPRDDSMGDAGIAYIRIYGEGSEEAMGTIGDIKRYTAPLSAGKIPTFQGISGLVPYKGMAKPGIESYYKSLQESVWHVGAPDLSKYRKKVVLIRLSEEAKRTARPHGIDLIGD